MIGLIPHKKAFVAYARSFFCGNSETDYNLNLKLEHSLNVLDNAEGIISQEKFDSQELEYVIRLAALYHDVGRFEQFSKYKTYKDCDSVNHGSLGAAMLVKEKFLAREDRNIQKDVLGAVTLHNRATLPVNLKGYMLTATKAVRDADKLDIISLLIRHLREAGPDKTNAVLMNLEPSATDYTKNIFIQVYNRKQVNYDQMRWTNDFKLFLLSWSYQLNFKSSRVIFNTRNYFDEIFEILPDNREMVMLKDQLAG